MNQRATTLTVLSALLIAALIVSLERRESEPSSPRPANAAPDSLQPLTGEPAPAVRSHSLSAERASLDLPAGAIENEAILAFDSLADLERFRAAAETAGLRTLAVNPQLRSLRLRLPADRRRALAELAGPEARIESNFTVLTPFPVSPESAALGPAFEAGALAFLGVAPEGNAAWGAGVTVAILDTGVGEHPTLAGVAIERLDLLDAEAANSPSHSYHGTAVASLIAGRHGTGIAPAASLLDIRVLDGEGIGDTFTLAQGIVEAADRGATIINLSLGSFGYSQTLADAVEYAQQSGAVLVASAGNESASILPYPAQLEGVIAVAAIDATGQHASFSNQGERVDLAAPGVGVYAAGSEEHWISFTGTSAAAPYVAGSIAAILSQNPRGDAQQAARQLAAHANDTGPAGADSLTGAGVIDLERALRSSDAEVLDLALADIYLPPDGEAIVITAQNRGTRPVSAAKLTFSGNEGALQEIHLGQLAPGETASHTVPLSQLSPLPEGVLRVAARVSHRGDDAKAANDSRSLRHEPQAPEDEESGREP